jgi:predicted ATPase
MAGQVDRVVVQGTELVGRERELADLEAVLAELRGGRSSALVLRGERGIGKSALLQALVRQAEGIEVLQVGCVQAEKDLRFAVLDQLVRPLAHRAGDLPEAQRSALEAAFGLGGTGTVDRLFLSLAVLALLNDAAASSPVLCVIDDAQWLDSASAEVLSFVARRLQEQPVGLVATTTVEGDALAGLPELPVQALPDADA